MYMLLKALHVCAVLVFVGGLLVDAVVLAASGAAPHALFKAVRHWDRTVTSPAIVFTWLLGLALIALGGWFHSGWLMAKLLIVFVLSGVHGMLSGAIRRAADNAGEHVPKPRERYIPYAVVAGVSLVAVLVILKPF
jgi:protoporphyrinogen IX oxidase